MGKNLTIRNMVIKHKEGIPCEAELYFDDEDLRKEKKMPGKSVKMKDLDVKMSVAKLWSKLEHEAKEVD